MAPDRKGAGIFGERKKSMRIRPYIESKDFEHVEQWIDTEKIHALWCAGLIPYPVTRQNLRILLAVVHCILAHDPGQCVCGNRR